MANLLVVRNDKLGDFMLAWPALSLLKRQYPDARITMLVQAYTSPMADLCPWIDAQLIDDERGAWRLARRIRTGRFDASISLFSEWRTALALWLARVPQRVGPATKAAQLFLNRTLKQRRSRSEKPEHEYNSDLARHYVGLLGDRPVDPAPAPYLRFDAQEIRALREQTMRAQGIVAGKRLVCIHPGSGGSAVNLGVEQYATLARVLEQAADVHFVITAGPDELDTAQRLAGRLPEGAFSVHHSQEGLPRFARFLAACDLFISGSTGPLHIAGALDVPTAAFYPARRSATPLRWQTLNAPGRRIAFAPERYDPQAASLDVDVEQCAARIAAFLGTLEA